MRYDAIKVAKVGAYTVSVYVDETPVCPNETTDMAVFLYDRGDRAVRRATAYVNGEPEKLRFWHVMDQLVGREALGPLLCDFYVFTVDAQCCAVGDEVTEQLDPDEVNVTGVVLVPRCNVTGNTDEEKTKLARVMAEAHVQEMKHWANGEVYGYVIEKEGVHVHSCWGFYGEPDHAMSDGRSEADAMECADAKQLAARRAEGNDPATEPDDIGCEGGEPPGTVYLPVRTLVTGDWNDDPTPVIFEPWTDGHAVGFKCTRGDHTEYVFLSPSTGGDSPDVFLYHGAEEGDLEATYDGPVCFVNVCEVTK